MADEHCDARAETDADGDELGEREEDALPEKLLDADVDGDALPESLLDALELELAVSELEDDIEALDDVESVALIDGVPVRVACDERDDVIVVDAVLQREDDGVVDADIPREREEHALRDT